MKMIILMKQNSKYEKRLKGNAMPCICATNSMAIYTPVIHPHLPSPAPISELRTPSFLIHNCRLIIYNIMIYL